MSDEVSAFQALVNSLSVMYSQNKVVISFIGGAITFGVPHAYKIYKFFVDRQDLKESIRDELIEEAHKNRTLVQNASNILAEMIAKARSGVFYQHNSSSVLFYLTNAERKVVRPAVEHADEFYAAVSEQGFLSLKKLKGYKRRAKKIRHTNELALAGFQARLKEYGVQVKLLGSVE